MISHLFADGRLFVTDTAFGAVVPGDDTFGERCQKVLDWKPERVVWMNQTHSANVQIIDDVADAVAVVDDCDGIITQEKNLLMVTKTADCVPVLLRNSKDAVIAALHCGWKGFFRGVLESFAERCQERGWNMKDFSGFLGPHLRVSHFEVQQDFIDQIPDSKRSFLQELDGVMLYDMTQGVSETLRSFGINDLHDCEINTYTDPTYFSYRGWCHLPEASRPPSYSTFANALLLQ